MIIIDHFLLSLPQIGDVLYLKRSSYHPFKALIISNSIRSYSDDLNHLRKKHLRKFVMGTSIFLIAFVIILLTNDLIIARKASSRLYYDVNETPGKLVAIVLGTSKYSNGAINLYYEARIKAAVDLFQAGKIHGILVSGDNATLQYDEPTTMQKDLIKSGIPAEYITMDYAGFRTLDSMIRAQKVFGLNEILIISQRFHCERALYISDAIGIEAVGFCAEDVPITQSLRIRTREVFARAMAFIDVNIVNRQPRFLGKREVVNIRKGS
jgi:SanA protein